VDYRKTESSQTLPLVSVIIPVYNGEHFLSDAIGNVLKQGYAPLEILVIDDGSTDRTSAIANHFESTMHYVCQNNKGHSSARNTGLALATGEVIAFLDVDDLWPEDKLTLQIPRLLPSRAIDVVMGRVEFFWNQSDQKRTLSTGNPINCLMNVYLGSGVFKRHVFQQVGKFDEDLRYSEDHDWFLRARERGIGIMIMEQVALYHRVHEYSMTAKKEAFGFQLPRVLKNSLERRRKTRKSCAMSLPKMSTFCEKVTRV